MRERRQSGPSRRAFLRAAAAAGPSVAASERSARATAAAQGTGTEGGGGWFVQPLRWANVTLVQDDPGRYDPDFWLHQSKGDHS